ncbi:hypothetical protein CsatB_020965 [Cannabis sativa]
MRRNFDLECIGTKERENDGLGESESFEKRAELLKKSEDKIDDLRASRGERENSVGVLDRIFELGVKRLKVDAVVGDDDANHDNRTQNPKVATIIEEGDLVCLRKVIWVYADVFDALCLNIQRQIRGGWEGYDPSDLAITTQSEENATKSEAEDEDMEVLCSIQRTVQLAHLDVIKECAKERNVNEAALHSRFLHFDYGV